MALQVNVGTVQVTNGSTTVRHEWKLLMTGITGTFAVNAAVSWAGGGTGTVGAWDPVGNVLHVARTAGPNPAAGTLISQSTPSVASATVSSVAPGSPPAWDAKVTLPAVATFERHYGDYQVASRTADAFVLTTAYLGASARNIEYGLNTDFTSLGLGLVRPGDVGAINIVTRSMVRLNTLLTRGAASLGLSSNLALSAGTVTINWTVEIEDTGGFVSVVPTTTMVIPAGIRRVDVGVNVALTTALSTGSQVVELKLFKGATEIAGHALTSPGSRVQIGRAGLLVVAGEQLSVQITAAGSSLPSVLAAATSFSIRVAEVI